MAKSTKKRGASAKKPATKAKPTKKTVRKTTKRAKAPPARDALELPALPPSTPSPTIESVAPATPPPVAVENNVAIRVTVRKFLFAAKNATVQLLKENAEVASCSTDSSGLAGFAAPPGKYLIVCGSKTKEVDAQKDCDVTLRL